MTYAPGDLVKVIGGIGAIKQHAGMECVVISAKATKRLKKHKLEPATEVLVSSSSLGRNFLFYDDEIAPSGWDEDFDVYAMYVRNAARNFIEHFDIWPSGRITLTSKSGQYYDFEPYVDGQMATLADMMFAFQYLVLREGGELYP